MKSWTNLVYAGMYTGTGTYLVAIVLTFLALTQGSMDAEEHKNTGLDMRPIKVGGLILSLLSEMLVWTAMYLAFNPVGAERIKGVQGRYLFPYVFLMVLLFYNRKIECRLEKKTVNCLIVGAASFITFVTIYMVYYSGLWMNVL